MAKIGEALHADQPGPLGSALRARVLAAGASIGKVQGSAATALATPIWGRPAMRAWGAAAVALVAWFVAYPLVRGMVAEGGRMVQHQEAAHFSVPAAQAVAPTEPVSMSSAKVATRAYDAMSDGGSPGGKSQHRRWDWPALRAASASSLAATPALAREVHHEAQVSLQVVDVEARSRAISDIVRDAGGYVANDDLTTGDDSAQHASLTLKAPVAQFNSVLDAVDRQGRVISRRVTGEDLTNQIASTQAEARALNRHIEQIQAQLNARITRVGKQERLDTLNELRSQLGETQGQLSSLRSRGAYSTLYVELEEKPAAGPAPKSTGFVQEMQDTMHAAFGSMVEAAHLPILTFIWILAYSPLWLGLILSYRWAVRR